MTDAMSFEEIRSILTATEVSRLEEDYGGSELYFPHVARLTPDHALSIMLGYQRALFLVTFAMIPVGGVVLAVPAGRMSPAGLLRLHVDTLLLSCEPEALIALTFDLPEQTIARCKTRLIDAGLLDRDPAVQASRLFTDDRPLSLGRGAPTPGDPGEVYHSARYRQEVALLAQAEAQRLAQIEVARVAEAEALRLADMEAEAEALRFAEAEAIRVAEEEAARLALDALSLSSDPSAAEAAAHDMTENSRPKGGKRTAR